MLSLAVDPIRGKGIIVPDPEMRIELEGPGGR